MNNEGYRTYTIVWVVTVPANTNALNVITTLFQYQLPPGTVEGYVKSVIYDVEISRTDPVTLLVEVIPIAQNTNVRAYLSMTLAGGICNPLAVPGAPAGVIANGSDWYLFHPRQITFNGLRVLQGNTIDFYPGFTNALPVDVTATVNITLEVQELLK